MERVISACEGMIPLKQREGRVFRCSRRLRSTDPHSVLGDNTAWQYSQGYGATSPSVMGGTPTEVGLREQNTWQRQKIIFEVDRSYRATLFPESYVFRF